MNENFIQEELETLKEIYLEASSVTDMVLTLYYHGFTKGVEHIREVQARNNQEFRLLTKDYFYLVMKENKLHGESIRFIASMFYHLGKQGNASISITDEERYQQEVSHG